MIESAEEFVRLRTSLNQAEYSRAATEEVPEAVCPDVIGRFPEMREWIAHNKQVPVSILRILADDPDWQVRHMVAQKRKAPHDVLEKLARDTDEGVRARVAYNAKTPQWILDLLRHDPVELIADVARRRIAAL